MSDKAACPVPTDYEELLSDLYLYVNWRYCTKQLTTAQKELWADAIDLTFTGTVDRWWRTDNTDSSGPA